MKLGESFHCMTHLCPWQIPPDKRDLDAAHSRPRFETGTRNRAQKGGYLSKLAMRLRENSPYILMFSAHADCSGALAPLVHRRVSAAMPRPQRRANMTVRGRAMGQVNSHFDYCSRFPPLCSSYLFFCQLGFSRLLPLQA